MTFAVSRSRVVAAVLAAWLVAITRAGAADEPAPAKQTYTFKTVGETKIQADVYRPADTKTRPVMVWIHGGTLITGSKNAVPRNLLDLCRAEGYILVSIDYRLAPEVKVPAIAEDLEDAWRWLQEQGPKLFQADVSKVVVTGGSAGGYLTMLAGTRLKPRPTALVAYWGYGDVDGDWLAKPSEFYRTQVPLIDREVALKAVGKGVRTGSDVPPDDMKGRGQYYRYLRQNGLWTKEVTGFDPATDRAKLDQFCPVRIIPDDYPPILMIHGTTDTDVPYDMSAAMAQELTRQKKVHELITVPSAGHGLSGGGPKQVAGAHEKALAFIRNQLR